MVHGSRSTALACALLATTAWMLLPIAASAKDACPGNANALGTARTITIDTASQVGVGAIPAMPPLALGPHEYVLTFDDGPGPGTTPAKLAILAGECVKASFFMTGAHAQKWPQLVKQVAAHGHTIGTHSMSHTSPLPKLPDEMAIAEIRDGYTAQETALYGAARPPGTPRLFRFPFNAASDSLLAWTHKNDIAVIGVDISPADWRGDPAPTTLARLLDLLDKKDRGIILLHDTQPNTVAFLPQLLAEMKRRNLSIVNIVAQ